MVAMPQRVLIVETNEALAQRIQRTLRYHRLETELAHNGMAGLTAALRQPPNLVILNSNLIGLDSTRVYKTLKRHQRTAHIPVVLLTEQCNWRRAERGLMLAAQDYHLPANAFIEYTLVDLLRSIALIKP
jgi:two-component system phosphate regulon response regulator PhoB